MTDARYTNPNGQTGARVVPAHTVYGTPTSTLIAPAGSAVTGVARQQYTVMRPYQPPKRRERDNHKVALCTVEGCKAFGSESRQGLCLGHARSQGVITFTGCGKEGCKAMPKKGEEFCHWHKPEPHVEVEGSITEAELFDDDPG